MSQPPVPKFPILNDPYLRAIPWPMIASCEDQARENHYQSLRDLARRGGLSLCEACAVIEGRKWQKMDDDEARTRLVTMIQQKAWQP